MSPQEVTSIVIREKPKNVGKKNKAKAPPPKVLKQEFNAKMKQHLNKEVSKVDKKIKGSISKSSPGIKPIMMDILLGLTVPKEYPVVRWSSMFSQKASALANPFSVIVSSWGQASQTNNMLAVTDSLACLFRCPERHSIIYSQSTLLKSYNVYFAGGAGGVPATTATLVLPANSPKTAMSVYASATSTYAPHGSTLYAGSVSGSEQRFLWCDAYDTYSVTVTPTFTGNLQMISDTYYTGSGYVNAGLGQIFAVTTGTPFVAIVKNSSGGTPNLTPGYYGLAFACPAGGSITLTSGVISGTGASFGHRAIPNFDVNAASCEGTRILAASLMYTNTAAQLNLGGDIVMTQTDKGDNWMNYISTDLFTTVANLSSSHPMNLSHGGYGWLRPTETADFEYKTHLEYDSAGRLRDSAYPIDEQGSFMIMVTSCPDPLGAIGYYTIAPGIEYLTNDTYRDVEFASVHYRVYEEAINYLKCLQQFNENPLHISDLWREIKNTISGAIKGFIDYGLPVAKTALSIAALM